MSNSHPNSKGKRKGSAIYAQRGRRDVNKRRRIAQEARRAKPMKCGHGSSHRSPYDNRCRRCFAERGAA